MGREIELSVWQYRKIIATIFMNELELNTFLLKARRYADTLALKGRNDEGNLTIQVASLVAQRVLNNHPEWYKIKK